jgi:peptidoglycan/LPS O-acetylase OafA/YrhL
MKSTSGEYYPALDHVRAVAALMVFAWHFCHYQNVHASPPLGVPFTFFTEGHTGVALFMTLSGYLFAKLLDGRRIAYLPFFWNRALRLLPLLLVVLALNALDMWRSGTLDWRYVKSLAWGIVLPTLPNGAWSVVVEFHYYLLLPLILWVGNKSRWAPLAFLGLGMALRVATYFWLGEAQQLAYLTLMGRIDQFVLGMLAFWFRDRFAGRDRLAMLVGGGFLLFWYWFDLQGGFYGPEGYPSRSPLWIVLTTIEGLAYSILIAWYDGSRTMVQGRLSHYLALIGTYSYSIYLLHYFFVFKMPSLINQHLFELSTPYHVVAMVVPCFLLLMPVYYLSYRFIESPFLRFRKRYDLG